MSTTLGRWTLAAILGVATALTLAAPTTAADDATTPAKAVMAIAIASWSGTGADVVRDYFDEEALASLYDADFVAAYRAAAKFPAFEDGGSPFDWDVIIGGQDGCPLENITYDVKAADGPVTPVVVTFKGQRCFEGAETQEAVTTVIFQTVVDNGRPVIGDILVPDESRNMSLKTMMQGIANQ